MRGVAGVAARYSYYVVDTNATQPTHLVELLSTHTPRPLSTPRMNMRSALLLLLAVPAAGAFVAPRHAAGRSKAGVATIAHQLPMVSEPIQRSLLQARLKNEGKVVANAAAESSSEAESEPELVEAIETVEPASAPVSVPAPPVAASASSAPLSSVPYSDPGSRSGDEITSTAIDVPSTAERKAAAAVQRAANREISKKLAAQRAVDDAAKQKQKMEDLLAKPSTFKDRVEKIASRVAFSKLLPSAEEVVDTTSNLSSSIEKFNAREAANKLALREESNTELLSETASGLARTAVEGFNTGVELADAIGADEELKSLVGEALATAGEATGALIGPDPLDDGDAVSSLTRKAKVAYVALDSLGVAAYATLCGVLSYGKEGSAVAESASKTGEGFVKALSAIGALGVRSYDAIADAAQEGAAEASTTQTVSPPAPVPSPAPVSVPEPAASAPDIEEKKEVAEEAVVEAVEEEAPQVESSSSKPVDFQRELLAARLAMEKKSS